MCNLLIFKIDFFDSFINVGCVCSFANKRVSDFKPFVFQFDSSNICHSDAIGWGSYLPRVPSVEAYIELYLPGLTGLTEDDVNDLKAAGVIQVDCEQGLRCVYSLFKIKRKIQYCLVFLNNFLQFYYHVARNMASYNIRKCGKCCVRVLTNENRHCC